MTTSSLAQGTSTTGTPQPRRAPSWQLIGTVIVALALLAVGLWLRLHDLGVPFDRDSYDEGVYWQTLRAMSAGHPLYQQIFYSQPPIFMLSVYPFYMLFGQSIWAARLGIVALSLVGLFGALLLGWSLRGRLGALAALLLLVANPLYLAQSQTLQAEMPTVALSLLSVGLAYLWWEHPEGVRGMALAALTSVTVILSIFSKLFGLAALAPITLLAIAHLWRIYRQPAAEKHYTAASLVVGVLAAIITCILIMLPFISAWHQLVQSMINFHLAAAQAMQSSQSSNFSILQQGLTTPLTLVALFGAIVALLRRDWRVLPLLAWLIASLYLLWKEVPLFQHHLVILVPPLLGLAIMGILPFTLTSSRVAIVTRGVTIVALLLIVACSGINLLQSRSYLRQAHGHATATATSPAAGVVADIRAQVQPGQLIITDAQFLAAQANRLTPADLVDTSSVRIRSGYLTSDQLIKDASQPRVHAILFYTGRIHTPALASFYDWVKQHYRLVRDYSNGNGLWVKMLK